MTTTADRHTPLPTQWTSTNYSSTAAFVPQLTVRLIQLLDPQPTDQVLDVGCGDGKFTAKYLDHVKCVHGVDASESFVQSANEALGSSAAKSKFHAAVVDCRFLDTFIKEKGYGGGADKVVSNAALHWILRDPATRLNTLRGCFDALKPGGIFAFEMGGAGNVAEMHVAFMSALLHHTSCTLEEAREVSPWFFPDVREMTALLETVGFECEKEGEEGALELQYRPTVMESTAEGKPNLEGWVRMMGQPFLERAEKDGGEAAREKVVAEVCGVVSTLGVNGRADGRGEFGYVRLRGRVRKPVA